MSDPDMPTVADLTPEEMAAGEYVFSPVGQILGPQGTVMLFDAHRILSKPEFQAFLGAIAQSKTPEEKRTRGAPLLEKLSLQDRILLSVYFTEIIRMIEKVKNDPGAPKEYRDAAATMATAGERGETAGPAGGKRRLRGGDRSQQILNMYIAAAEYNANLGSAAATGGKRRGGRREGAAGPGPAAAAGAGAPEPAPEPAPAPAGPAAAGAPAPAPAPARAPRKRAPARKKAPEEPPKPGMMKAAAAMAVSAGLVALDFMTTNSANIESVGKLAVSGFEFYQVFSDPTVPGAVKKLETARLEYEAATEHLRNLLSATGVCGYDQQLANWEPDNGWIAWSASLWRGAEKASPEVLDAKRRRTLCEDSDGAEGLVSQAVERANNARATFIASGGALADANSAHAAQLFAAGKNFGKVALAEGNAWSARRAERAAGASEKAQDRAARQAAEGVAARTGMSPAQAAAAVAAGVGVGLAAAARDAGPAAAGSGAPPERVPRPPPEPAAERRARPAAPPSVRPRPGRGGRRTKRARVARRVTRKPRRVAYY